MQGRDVILYIKLFSSQVGQYNKQGQQAQTCPPESEIYGVITFYSQFRLRPMGKYGVRACAGTACHVSGAKMITETIEDEIGVGVGDTSEDGLFTLQTVACIGCCSLAPVVMINDDTHGSLNPASTRKLIRRTAREAKKADSTPDKSVEKTVENKAE